MIYNSQVVFLLLCFFTTTFPLSPSPHLVVVMVDKWNPESSSLVEEGVTISNYYSPPLKGGAITSLLSGTCPHKSQALSSESLNCSTLLGGLLE